MPIHNIFKLFDFKYMHIDLKTLNACVKKFLFQSKDTSRVHFIKCYFMTCH